LHSDYTCCGCNVSTSDYAALGVHKRYCVPWAAVLANVDMPMDVDMLPDLPDDAEMPLALPGNAMTELKLRTENFHLLLTNTIDAVGDRWFFTVVGAIQRNSLPCEADLSFVLGLSTPDAYFTDHTELY